MKASEMTNEQLSKKLKRYITKSVAKEWPAYAETILDAAARLRRPTPVDDDLLKMARDIDNLRAKLKVAEDALVVCRDGMCGECQSKHPGETCVCPNGCYEMSLAKNALAAIREEGGAR